MRAFVARTSAGVHLVMGPGGSWHVGCVRPPGFDELGGRAPWCLVLRAQEDEAQLALCPSCADYVNFVIARYAPN